MIDFWNPQSGFKGGIIFSLLAALVALLAWSIFK